MLPAVIFLVASVLLGAFIALRAWEEKRGIRLWSRARLSADQKVVEAYQAAVTGSFPRHYRVRLLAIMRDAVHKGVLLLVAGLRAVERPLTRLSYRMRMAASNPNKKEVSSFLKTIVPHKGSWNQGPGKSAKTEESV